MADKKEAPAKVAIMLKALVDFERFDQKGNPMSEGKVRAGQVFEVVPMKDETAEGRAAWLKRKKMAEDVEVS